MRSVVASIQVIPNLLTFLLPLVSSFTTPARRNGNATPGSPFILDDGVEKRSFTFTGPFTDLHAFFVGDAKMNLRLFSPSASYDITVAETTV